MAANRSPAEARALGIVLAINAAMFLAEAAAGVLAQSTGLLADSFDMLADAVVYGLALFAAAGSDAGRVRSARWSGYLQLGLGTGALADVARRAVVGSDPEPGYMIGVAAIALVANVACLRLVAAHREGGVHMTASYIFSKNDVIANVAVIASGALVAWTGRPFWDLLVGAGIGLLLLSGGVRILKVTRAARAER